MTIEAGAAGAPAGTPPAGTPPAGTPPAGTPPAGTPPPAPWHGVTDPVEAAFIDNKGWKSPADVIKSYKGVEKLVGRDPESLLSLPKPGDTAGWEALYSRLGRPESPDKYDLKIGAEGLTVDEGFQKQVAGMLHKAGVSTEQAKVIAGEYNTFLKAQNEQAAKDYELNVTTDKQALLKEWGGGFERKMNAAQAGVAALGFDNTIVNAIEGAIGYGATMRLFAGLGEKLTGDHRFVGPDGAPKFSGAMTAPEAAAEIEKLKGDKDFQSTLHDKQHPNYKTNLKKWQDLFAVAYPE
jgi:hypothetical protein